MENFINTNGIPPIAEPYGGEHVKGKSLFAVLLGLLVVCAAQVSAYNHWHVGPVSTSGTHGDEYIAITGSDPIQGDGNDPSQTIVVSSTTPTEDQTLCLLSGGCYIPRNKRISLQAEPLSSEAANAYVEFQLVEIITNDGTEQSTYQFLADVAADLLWNAIKDHVPGSWISEDLVKLFKDLSSHPYIQRYGENSIQEGIGDVPTGGAIFKVTVKNRDRLPPGTYYYSITATSTTDIYYYSHQSWIFGINKPKGIDRTDPITPMDYSYKVETLRKTIGYELKYIKNG